MQTTPTAQFRTKKSIKEAMGVGSRWTLERDGEQAAITIVRASSSSRWFRFDDYHAASTSWLPLKHSAEWAVHPDGFADEDGTRLRYIAPAPADLDQARFARLALATNRRDGNCTDCGGHVAAGTGHIRNRTGEWQTIHAYGACAPRSAAA